MRSFYSVCFVPLQVHTLLSSIEFRLRDLSNMFRREQQTERINSRMDMIFNKIGHLEVSSGMWFDKCQQVTVRVFRLKR